MRTDGLNSSAAVQHLRGGLTIPPPASRDGALEVAFAVDAALLGIFPITLRSVTVNSESPLRVTLLTRGTSYPAIAALSREFPKVHFAWFDADRIRYPLVHLLPHTTTSTLDRIWLPRIIEWAARVIYLDVDVAVQTDLRPLYERDLSGRGLAGRTSLMADWRTGAALAAEHLPRLSRRARAAFRAEFGSHKSMRFACFNAGVLVLDLDALRECDFTGQTLRLVRDYGLNDQYAINFFCRGDFDPLEPTWNHFVGQENFADPAIVHYVGPKKPWLATPCAHRDAWLRYRATPSA